jgi:hypothetical protein
MNVTQIIDLVCALILAVVALVMLPRVFAIKQFHGKHNEAFIAYTGGMAIALILGFAVLGMLAIAFMEPDNGTLAFGSVMTTLFSLTLSGVWLWFCWEIKKECMQITEEISN